MGNVNGSESPTGTGSSSGLVVEEEEEELEEEDGDDEILVGDVTENGTGSGPAPPPPPPVGVGVGVGVGAGVPVGLMPQSPPAPHSPLKFVPQPPVAPIQQPDQLFIPNPSWLSPGSPQEDISYEQGIPTMISWSSGGEDVAVEGSWDNFKTRKPLERSGKDFSLMKVLPSGVYQYRFIVDGTWRYAPDIPWAQDESGNYYNILDLQDYVPEDTENISEFEPPQSPDNSYNNSELSPEDFAKDPPLVPPHLHMTLLNVPAPCTETPPPLSRPQHVVLNHLYMQKGKGGPSVVALGSTHRFKSKYVTVVLYKSLKGSF